MTHPFKATILALALLWPMASLAQTTDLQTPDPVARLLPPAATVGDEGVEPRVASAAPDAAEARVTRALNDEIVARNQLAENQDRADLEAYEQERARYQVVVDQATRDRLAYEEAAREWEVAKDRAEEARGRYAADLLACRAGDRSRCPR
ncbi:hypothetical protein BZG35_03440 [Brevundimonas sp. LM2]|uniref:hypothetical protein n=1 Tax=Brevundimonas sp. LM2 TaxID=1938605 RepID=UPI000983B35F|nr:hypothetical protein [Brevundimonas sp. LM2]AQR60811.1 hypothetical protein BZG35_03440 [Brevundimonas sp. LM2]